MSPAAWLLRTLVLGYKYLLSPVLPMACRYQPSCSSYALEAVQRFGAGHGGLLALRRLCRCRSISGSWDRFTPRPAGRRARSSPRSPSSGLVPIGLARPARPPYQQSLSAAAPGSKHAR